MANLTPEQKQSVTQWIQDGSGLSDIQKRLRDEFSVSLTYMDVRMLVDDLKLGDTHGAIALWSHTFTDGYFANLRIIK